MYSVIWSLLHGDSLLLPGARSEPLSMNIAGQIILFYFRVRSAL
jgi:hypothetical protein